MFVVFTLAFGAVLATTLSRSDLTTYAKIFSIGIVALSLVPLVGFAGQISLCQLSFAGIGAVCMAHYGAGGSPMGVLVAVVVCALVGALVALPALRLSGIYMALATAAFAVFLDRWVFNLPDFSVGPIDVQLLRQRLGAGQAAQAVRGVARRRRDRSSCSRWSCSCSWPCW